ncbi:MAG: alpha/beta fold hydrolase [Clostridia bacterium]|nr:alpha/beta fold hydrolase [Clostridia bacterium]
MNGKIGCLLIHGFAGGVHEVAPLRDYLEERGFEVVCPELKGHTGNRKDLIGTNYKEWIASAEEVLVRASSGWDKVVIIGFSMGGLIGINLLTRHKAAAFISLCMPVVHWDIKRVFLNLLEDFKSRTFENLRHYMKSAVIPVPALLNFKVLLGKTKKLMKVVSCPVFIAQALKDDTVHHKSAEFIYSQIGSQMKEIKYYKNSGHVICQSPDGAELFRDVEEFIRKAVVK